MQNLFSVFCAHLFSCVIILIRVYCADKEKKEANNLRKQNYLIKRLFYAHLIERILNLFNTLP